MSDATIFFREQVFCGKCGAPLTVRLVDQTAPIYGNVAFRAQSRCCNSTLVYVHDFVTLERAFDGASYTFSDASRRIAAERKQVEYARAETEELRQLLRETLGEKNALIKDHDRALDRWDARLRNANKKYKDLKSSIGVAKKEG